MNFILITSLVQDKFSLILPFGSIAVIGFALLLLIKYRNYLMK